MANPVEVNGDYLMVILAPKLPSGTYKVIVEKEFLEESIVNLLNQLPQLSINDVTVYELKKVEIG